MGLVISLVLQVADTPLWLLLLRCPTFVVLEHCRRASLSSLWSLFGCRGRFVVVLAVCLHLLSFSSP
jgi:hypothetical protein